MDCEEAFALFLSELKRTLGDSTASTLINVIFRKIGKKAFTGAGSCEDPETCIKMVLNGLKSMGAIDDYELKMNGNKFVVKTKAIFGKKLRGRPSLGCLDEPVAGFFSGALEAVLGRKVSCKEVACTTFNDSCIFNCSFLN